MSVNTFRFTRSTTTIVTDITVTTAAPAAPSSRPRRRLLSPYTLALIQTIATLAALVPALAGDPSPTPSCAPPACTLLLPADEHRGDAVQAAAWR